MSIGNALSALVAVTIAASAMGQTRPTTRAVERDARATWNEFVAALRASSEERLGTVACDQVVEELARGISNATDRAQVFAAIGQSLARDSLRIRTETRSLWIINIGPEIKEATFVFVRGNDGWKLTKFVRGQ